MAVKNVSIIIVNFNGYKYVLRCVKSILMSKSSDLEIIIVDNGSNGDAYKLKETFKNKTNVKIVALPANYGPARARNEGVNASSGKIIGFLDNDTVVDPRWLNEAATIFYKNNTVGIVQCKLLLLNDRKKFDYIGEYIGQNGFLVQRVRAGEEDKGQYDQSVEILAAKSAGMFIRRSVFEKIGGFDEDYFIYVEETDLGWRSWLHGHRAVFCPTSIVYHEFGTSTVILGKKQNEYNAKFHGSKNYILTLIKNLEGGSLISIIPLHILLWIGLAWYTLFRGNFKAFLYVHLGILWNLINLPHSMKKRNLIQLRRKISDAELFKIVMKKRDIWYFVNKVIHTHRVGNAESF